MEAADTTPQNEVVSDDNALHIWATKSRICETIRKRFWSSNEREIWVDYPIPDEDSEDSSIPITAEEFQKCCSDVCKQIEKSIEKCRENTERYVQENIDHSQFPEDVAISFAYHVEVVGGGSRVVHIRDSIARAFQVSIESLGSQVNAEEGNADGCALYAAQIAKHMFELVQDNPQNVFTLIDFCPGLKKYEVLDLEPCCPSECLQYLPETSGFKAFESELIDHKVEIHQIGETCPLHPNYSFEVHPSIPHYKHIQTFLAPEPLSRFKRNKGLLITEGKSHTSWFAKNSSLYLPACYNVTNTDVHRLVSISTRLAEKQERVNELDKRSLKLGLHEVNQKLGALMSDPRELLSNDLRLTEIESEVQEEEKRLASQ